MIWIIILGFAYPDVSTARDLSPVFASRSDCLAAAEQFRSVIVRERPHLAEHYVLTCDVLEKPRRTYPWGHPNY